MLQLRIYVTISRYKFDMMCYNHINFRSEAGKPSEDKVGLVV